MHRFLKTTYFADFSQNDVLSDANFLHKCDDWDVEDDVIMLLVPLGTSVNSPAIHRWEYEQIENVSPVRDG